MWAGLTRETWRARLCGVQRNVEVPFLPALVHVFSRFLVRSPAFALLVESECPGTKAMLSSLCGGRCLNTGAGCAPHSPMCSRQHLQWQLAPCHPRAESSRTAKTCPASPQQEADPHILTLSASTHPWLQVWQALLSVRALVLPPSQDVHTYLKFSSLCRKSGRVRSVQFVRDLSKPHAGCTLAPLRPCEWGHL